MVCDNCRVGISFDGSCFHCGEHWKERFISNVINSKDIKETLQFELDCLEEEVFENWKRE